MKYAVVLSFEAIKGLPDPKESILISPIVEIQHVFGWMAKVAKKRGMEVKYVNIYEVK